MTANEIAWQQLQETKRANAAKERENYRSNKAKEDEAQRSNLEQENTARYKAQTERGASMKNPFTLISYAAGLNTDAQKGLYTLGQQARPLANVFSFLRGFGGGSASEGELQGVWTGEGTQSDEVNELVTLTSPNN